MNEIKQTIDNLKEAVESNKDRIYFVAIDGENGEIISNVCMVKKYYNEKGLHVVEKAAERLGDEVSHYILKNNL